MRPRRRSIYDLQIKDQATLSSGVCGDVACRSAESVRKTTAETETDWQQSYSRPFGLCPGGAFKPENFDKPTHGVRPTKNLYDLQLKINQP